VRTGNPRAPRRWPLACLLGLAALVPLTVADATSAAGPNSTRWDALPRTSERLAEPIRLPHCGMPIVEWRSTSALPLETTPSARAVAVVDEACRNAFDRYAAFLRSKNLPQPQAEADDLPALSLLPGNVALDGKSPRALNDLPSRFEAVAPGCCYWGIYVESLNHLFIRNDPLTRDASGAIAPNPRFVRTLTHEISHVLSSRLGVWSVLGYNRQRDEELAEDFVAYMGISFPTESSKQDLALHRAGSTTLGTPWSPPAPP